jgi:FkbM family methyltransferase
LETARKIVRRIPPKTVLPILTGPLRGTRWIIGASRNAYWLGTYEHAKCSVFAHAIAEGDVVYDVGAHVGYYTLLAAKLVGPRGHVYAFEPLPANLEFLELHLKLNQITNVTVVPAAVADTAGLGSFQLAPSRAMARLAPSESSHAPRELPMEMGADCELQVKTVSLDDWARQAGRSLPRVIKMDIEGAELQALHGAAELLRRAFPTLLVATHSKALHQACQNFLSRLGYCVELLEWVAADERGELVARQQ